MRTHQDHELTPAQVEQLLDAYSDALTAEATAYTQHRDALARLHDARQDANWPAPEDQSEDVLALAAAKTEARDAYNAAITYRCTLGGIAYEEGLL